MRMPPGSTSRNSAAGTAAATAAPRFDDPWNSHSTWGKAKRDQWSGDDWQQQQQQQAWNERQFDEDTISDGGDSDEVWKVNRIVSIPPPKIGSRDRPIPVVKDILKSPTDSVTRVRQEQEEKEWKRREDDRDQDVLRRAAEKRVAHSSTPTSVKSGRRFTRVGSDDAEESSGSGKQRKGLLRFFGGGGRKKKNAPDSFSSEPSDSSGGVDLPPTTQASPRQPSLKPTARSATNTVARRWNSSINNNNRKSEPPRVMSSGAGNHFAVVSVGNSGSKNHIQPVVSHEESTVSEMTNPTYFQHNNERRLAVETKQNKNSGALDAFDVNSPLFSSGDPFHSNKTKSPAVGELTEMKSDEFSDPFFPSSLAENSPRNLHSSVMVEEKKEETRPSQPFEVRRSSAAWRGIQNSRSATTPTHRKQQDFVESSPRGSAIRRTASSPRKPSKTLSAMQRSPVHASQTSKVVPSKEATEPKPVTTRSASPIPRRRPDSYQARASSRFTEKLQDRRYRTNPAPRFDSADVKEKKETKAATSSEGAKNSVSADRINAKYRSGKLRATHQVTSPPPPPPPPPPVASAKKKSKGLRRPKKLELVRSTDEDTKQLEEVPVYASETHVASSAKKKADTYAYTHKRKGMVAKGQETGRGKKNLEVVRSTSGDEGSLANKSSDSNSISSVGSDIRRLRSILRRSRNPTTPSAYKRTASHFAAYSGETDDPMQRAGFRLLSAAIIPIQCLVRRHLALREALTRMWALVVIQSCARRWLVCHQVRKWNVAAMKIQSVARGGQDRERLILEHCCAIEIQRHVRGYLATLDVYDMMYKITIIQACVRRSLAINDAMDRMVSVIQVQSAARRFLVCTRLANENEAATTIQARFRSYSARLDYKLNLLDIVIVQSVWRRHAAKQFASTLLAEKRNKAALLIQTSWRSYDCTMNYLHFLADVVISQSAVRRWMACREVSILRFIYALRIQTAFRAFNARLMLRREKSAIAIQKTWRGFVGRDIALAKLQERLAATAIQRAWFDFQFRTEMKNTAATLIQKIWRGFVAFSAYQEELAAIDEQISAIYIQKTWRGYICYKSYQEQLDILEANFAAIYIQKMWRGYVGHRFYQEQLAAIDAEVGAMCIQSAWRGYVCRRKFTETLSAIEIQSAWRGFVCRRKFTETVSAIEIQSAWRGFVCRRKFTETVSAIEIQSAWRGFVCRRKFTETVSAIKIQSAWRGFVCRRKFTETVSAIKIQSAWRQLMDKRIVDRIRSEKKAATVIQKSWRGFVCYADYMFTIADVVIIQSLARCRATRKRFRQLVHATTVIQSVVRGHIARVKAASLCSAISTVLLQSVQMQSARTLQRVFRGHFSREQSAARREQSLRDTSATIIQSKLRSHSLRKMYSNLLAVRRLTAVVTIQRMIRCRHSLKNKAAISIQSSWRRFISETELFIRKYEHQAAVRIQSAWRKFWCFSTYFIALDSATTIQAAVRSMQARSKVMKALESSSRLQAAARAYLARREVRIESCVNAITSSALQVAARESKASVTIRSLSHVAKVAYKKQICARKVQLKWRSYREFVAARRIQSTFRRYVAASAVAMHLQARKIQSTWRCYAIRASYVEFLAARAIQSLWRSCSTRMAYIEYIAARLLQKSWRGVSVRRSYHRYIGARKFQSLYRGYVVKTAYNDYMAARTIQTLWRGLSTREAYRAYIAARLIQSQWRGASARQEHQTYLCARTIQAAWRRKRARKFFVRLRVRVMAKEIRAAVFVQRVVRGYQVRCVRPTFTTWLEKLSKTYRAAMAIQKMYRGYKFRMEYWQVLGSTIQIQAFVRGVQAVATARRLAEDAINRERAAVLIQSSYRRWMAQNDFLEVAGAIIVIQMHVRGYFARKEFKQRQFISMLCESASIASAQMRRRKNSFSDMVSSERIRRTNSYNSMAAASDFAPLRSPGSDLSDWEVVIARQREVDHAARKIQRFFLFVRAEVDREVRLEKKRRRARKKSKRKKEKKEVEDDLLENVWRKTVDRKEYSRSDSRLRRAEAAAAAEIQRSRSSSRTRTRDTSATRPRNQTPSSRNKLPPQYRNPSPLSVRIHTSSSFKEDTEVIRVPPSRLATLSRSEMDEDFDLEEAWIDAEINNVRARRLAEKDSRRAMRASSNARASSRSRVRSSERPPNYRTLEL